MIPPINWSHPTPPMLSLSRDTDETGDNCADATVTMGNSIPPENSTGNIGASWNHHSAHSTSINAWKTLLPCYHPIIKCKGFLSLPLAPKPRGALAVTVDARATFRSLGGGQDHPEHQLFGSTSTSIAIRKFASARVAASHYPNHPPQSLQYTQETARQPSYGTHPSILAPHHHLRANSSTISNLLQ